MKHSFKKTSQRLAVGIGLVVLLPFAQNCSGFHTGAASGASSATPLVTQASSVLSASANPSAPIVGGSVVLTPDGGAAPYTYTLSSNNGVLAGNVFTPSAAGPAQIVVYDSAGHSFSVNFVVSSSDPAASPTPAGSGGGLMPAPTPIIDPPSTTSSTTLPSGVALPRSCTVPVGYSVTGDVNYDVAYGTFYQYCMILGRGDAPAENIAWYNYIVEDGVPASQMAISLFGSQEFAQHYGTSTMTNNQFAVLLVRLLCYREPTAQEIAGLASAAGGVTGSAGQSAMVNAAMSSAAFQAANPYLVQLQAAYQD